MIDEVITERTLEFVPMCKCSGVFCGSKTNVGVRFARIAPQLYGLPAFLCLIAKHLFLSIANKPPSANLFIKLLFCYEKDSNSKAFKSSDSIGYPFLNFYLIVKSFCWSVT